MLKDLYEAIGQQAVKALAPAIITTEREPDHVYFVRKPDGSLVKEGACPRPRKHHAADLSAIIEFARENKEEAAVWYSRNRVVCVVNDATRRDTVTLPLSPSPQMEHLNSLGTGKEFGQAELILLLRTTYADCLSGHPDLIKTLRQVKFKSRVDGESTVNHGKRSLGKSIEQQIEGTAELPEYLTLYVPVFASAFRFSEPVRLALEPNAEKERFGLIVLPGEIEWARVHAEERIGTLLAEELADAEVSLLYGDPRLKAAE